MIKKLNFNIKHNCFYHSIKNRERQFKWCPLLFSMCFLFFYTMPCIADESSYVGIHPDTLSVLNGTLPDNEDKIIDPSEDSADKADAFHTALSMKISSSADWIDSFFRDERVEIEENNTSLRLKFYGFYEKGESIDFKVRARFRFVLPHLENRLHLFISSALNEDKGNTEYFRFSEEDDSQKNIYVSLRYFFKAAERKNISIRSGFKFHGWSPDFYIGPRFRFSKKMGTWNFRYIEDFTHFSSDGWESETNLDAERPLSEFLFLRMNFNGEWFEKEKGHFYRVNTDLYGTISKNRMINYRLGTEFETYPKNRLKEVLVAIRYRQRFWKKWLFYEVTPQLAFRREDYKDPKPGITISIEGIFGKDFVTNTDSKL